SSGHVDHQIISTTITDAAGQAGGTSRDLDAYGVATGSRKMTIDQGNTKLDRINADGVLAGSATMTVDKIGNVTLESLDANGNIIDTKRLAAHDEILTITKRNGIVPPTVVTH